MAQRTVQVALAMAALSMAMVGCSAAHPSDEVRTGIYELMVESDADGCSPRRAVGSMGPVGVVVRGGAVDAPVPEQGNEIWTAPRVQLAPGASYHSETNRRITGCDGAWVHEEWTMMESDGEHFEVLHMQSWQGLDSCVDAPASAPETDCDAERRLQYDLQTTCEAPCSLHVGVSGAIVCAC